jgi:ParB family chromosome partitioning protein
VKRKALGRGLGALLPAAAATAGAPAADEGLVWLDLDQLITNPAQPRESFGEEELEELARSIQQNGVVQPVVVRRDKTGYQLIAGERRWRAAQKAGLRKLPAIVRRVSDDRILDLALIENLLRQDLNPVEEARGFQRLVDEHGLTQEEVARRLGMKRTTISNSLRILKLDSDVLDKVRRGILSAGHAKVLSGVADAADQVSLAREVEKRGLSVRGLEILVSRRQEKAASSPARSAPARKLDPNTLRAAENLTRALGTRVRIERHGKGGAVILEYYSEEELQRLYSLILDAARIGRSDLKGGHA